jgi:hypothetical protein
VARLLRLPISACVSRIAKPAGIELTCIRLFPALLASICSRPNNAKRCDGPCLVRRSSSYPSGRKGASGYTGAKKRENTIRQGARCISDMHDPKAAQAIVTQVTLSGCAAGCPSWSTWRAAGLRCLQPQTGIAFRVWTIRLWSRSLSSLRRCQANDAANCLRDVEYHQGLRRCALEPKELRLP